MTKGEMIRYLDDVLAGITTRGRIAPSVAKGRLRQDFKAVTAIREALEKFVPSDVPAAKQTPLFDDVTTRRG